MSDEREIENLAAALSDYCSSPMETARALIAAGYGDVAEARAEMVEKCWKTVASLPLRPASNEMIDAIVGKIGANSAGIAYAHRSAQNTTLDEAANAVRALARPGPNTA